MKKFIVNFFVFACCLFLICLAIDMYISGKMKESTQLAKGEYPVWNDIYAGKINSDLVIYGSSRAWVHFNPQMISDSLHISCYNLGIDGHKFPLQYFRHKEYLRNNRAPKIILYSLDVSSFVKEKELYNYDQFLPYMLFSTRIAQGTLPYEGFTLPDFIIPGLRYVGKKEFITDAFNHDDQTDTATGRQRGYMGRDEQWNNDLRTAKENYGSYNIAVNENIVKQFEQFTTACRQQNIQLVLVYSPEYIEGQKFVNNRKEIIELYEMLASKYQLPFYDFSSNEICYQKQYFYNATHMNKTGSALFTRLLIQKLANEEQVKRAIRSVNSTKKVD